MIAGAPDLAPDNPPVAYALDTPDRIYSDDLKDNIAAILAGMTSSLTRCSLKESKNILLITKLTKSKSAPKLGLSLPPPKK